MKNWKSILRNDTFWSNSILTLVPMPKPPHILEGESIEQPAETKGPRHDRVDVAGWRFEIGHTLVPLPRRRHRIDHNGSGQGPRSAEILWSRRARLHAPVGARCHAR